MGPMGFLRCLSLSLVGGTGGELRICLYPVALYCIMPDQQGEEKVSSKL